MKDKTILENKNNELYIIHELEYFNKTLLIELKKELTILDQSNIKDNVYYHYKDRFNSLILQLQYFLVSIKKNSIVSIHNIKFFNDLLNSFECLYYDILELEKTKNFKI